MVRSLTASKQEMARTPLISDQRQLATNNMIQSCASRDGRHEGRGVGAIRLGRGLLTPRHVLSRRVLLMELRSACELSVCDVRSWHAVRSHDWLLMFRTRYEGV